MGRSITFAPLPGFSPHTTPAGVVALGSVNAGDKLVLGGAIDDKDTLNQSTLTGLQKVGAGAVTLDAANTYGGATTVVQGVLGVANNGALGTARSATNTPQVEQIETFGDTTGSFTLTYNGVTTNPITFGATAAQVQTALNNLASIKAVGTVTVVRSPITMSDQTNGFNTPNSPQGFLYVVTFGPAFAGSDLPITADGTSANLATNSNVVTGVSTASDDGVDVLVQNGAELPLDGFATQTPSALGAVTVANHLLTLNGVGPNGAGALNSVNGDNVWSGKVVLATGVTVGVVGATSLTLSGVVTDNGAGNVLQKVLDGTLIIPDSAGAVPPPAVSSIIVSAGALQVDGVVNNVVLDGGTVSGSSTAAGNGTITSLSFNPPAVAGGSGGTVDPGDNYQSEAIGTLDVTNDVTFDPSDRLFVPLGAGQNDLLKVGGTINLNGSLLTGAVDSTVDVVAGTQQFTIITAGSVTGQFAGASATPTVAGASSATVAYLPDGTKLIVNYFTDHVVVTAVLTSPTIALTETNAAPAYGEKETFTATVTPEVGAVNQSAPSGNVVFHLSVDGATAIDSPPVPLVNGVATFDPTTLTGGPLNVGSTYTVTASYDGFNGNGVQVAQPVTSAAQAATVVQAGTTTALTSSGKSGSTPVYGQDITYTAVVSTTVPAAIQESGAATPSGSVNFYDNTVFIGNAAVVNGVATLDTALLAKSPAVGVHTITASYLGDANYTASNSKAVSQQVVRAGSQVTSVVSSAPSSSFGQAVTFTATVAAVAPGAGTPGGTLTFKIGNTFLGTATLVGSSGGVTTYSYTTTANQLQVGANQVVTANYNGDSNFTASSGTTLQTVNTITSGTSVTSSVNPSTYGQAVTFKAIVTVPSGSGVPTGTVTFKIGSTVLGAATSSTTAGVTSASYTTTAFQLPTGAGQTVSAVYSGDTRFATSTGMIIQTVNASATATAIAVSASSAVAGQILTFYASVKSVAPGSGVPAGTVNFYTKVGAGPQTYIGSGTLNAGGVATLQTGLTMPGVNTVFVGYVPSTNYATSVSGTTNVTVVAGGTRASTATLSVSPSPSVVGQPVTLTATVADAGPTPAKVPTGTVAFYDTTGGAAGSAGSVFLGYGTLATVGTQYQASYTTSAAPRHPDADGRLQRRRELRRQDDGGVRAHGGAARDAGQFDDGRRLAVAIELRPVGRDHRDGRG